MAVLRIGGVLAATGAAAALAGCGSQGSPTASQKAMLQAPQAAPTVPAGEVGKSNMMKYRVNPGLNPNLSGGTAVGGSLKPSR